MPADPEAAELCGSDAAVAAAAIRRLAQTLASDRPWRAERLSWAITELARCDLRAGERGRRVEALVRSLADHAGDDDTMAVLRAAPDSVRGAIAAALTPDLRRRLYAVEIGSRESGVGSRESSPSADLGVRSAEETQGQARSAERTQEAGGTRDKGPRTKDELEPVANRPAHADRSPDASRTRSPVDEGQGTKDKGQRTSGTVFLFSLVERPDLKNRLAAAGLECLRVADAAAPGDHKFEDACGFVIDRTMWSGTASADQDELLRRLAGHSSTACLFVAEEGFHEPARIATLVTDIRLRRPAAGELVVTDSGTPGSADIAAMAAAARMIDATDGPTVASDDLSPADARMLRVASAAFFREHFHRGGSTLKRVGLRTVGGGRSGAKVFQVQFNSAALPFIAKVGPRVIIREEVDRFETYIKPWDPGLSPFVHFRGEQGAILFSLVGDGSRPMEPAATFDDLLSKWASQEIWADSTPDCGSQVRAILSRAAERLSLLNRTTPMGRHESWAVISGEPLRRMIERGTRWSLPQVATEDLLRALAEGNRRLDPLRTAAVVHGDIQPRNILVPDPGTCRLIDYAFSGPGHPAFDLVRLECSVLFSRLRPVAGEDGFAELQRALSIERSGEPELRSRFADWFGSPLNAALLGGAVECRDRCLEVLAHHGADASIYRAAKFVVCADALQLPHLQLGLVRGAMQALAGEMLRG